MPVAGLLNPAVHTAVSPAPLTWKDVLVVSVDRAFTDDVRDPGGKLTQRASAFVTGLRQGAPRPRRSPLSSLPVRVIKEDDVPAVDEMACNSGPDAVVVTASQVVAGLERKVVVLLDAPKKPNSGDVTEQRFGLISRCTSQLIWVRHSPPPPPAAP